MAIVKDHSFSLFAPFDIVEKAGEEESSRGRIEGVASTNAMDADGEVVHQDGIDWSFFMDKGFISLEHPLGIGNIIGAPVEVKRKTIDGVDSTIIKADIFLDDPNGKSVFKKAKMLKKAGGERRLGFSIEGRCLERRGNEILKAKVHSVAVSAVPKNPHSYFEPIMASMLAAAMSGVGYQTPAMGAGIGNLVPQSMQGVSNATVEVAARMSDDELTSALLRKFPWMSWAQGEKILKTVKTKMGLK